jgi:hypothetical protein
MIGRLKGRSIREIGVRGGQAAAVLLERAGLAEHRRTPDASRFSRWVVSPGPRAALEAFRRRDAPAFPSFDDPVAAGAAVRHLWPTETAGLVDMAERALDGRFDLLGHRELSFGNPIDWQLDPISGRRAPLVHWSRIPYLDYETVGDHKVVWELNRHQHLVTLAQAWAVTGDERFSEGLLRQLSDWMDANPPKLGINWASSLEVAFRAISWTWALFLIRRSPALTPELLARALTHLHLHARHLEVHLSTYFSPNTHLTGEALGLVYVGTHFPELRHSGRWAEKGTRVLLEELGRQVRPDGVYFEQSTYYHRYTTDFYLHLALLHRESGGALDAKLRATLERLLDHIVALMRPDGRWPLIGDDDGGRLMPLNRRDANDFRDTVALGGALLGRPDYCFAAGAPAPELVWLLGTGGPARFERAGSKAPAVPKAFPDGGYFVMRDGWEPEANYLLADCGPLGGLNGGHGHADSLAVEVVALGAPVLVDPGTWTYVATEAERNAFRDSAAHSTVTVGGESSSRPTTPFRWAHRANATLLRWEERLEADYFEGTHDGYAHLVPPVEHQRAILFLRKRCWIVRDTVVGGSLHGYEVRWQCAPGIEAERIGPRMLGLANASGTGLVLAASAGTLEVEPAWSSPVFGSRIPATACASRIDRNGGDVVVTALVPARKGEHPQVEFSGGVVTVATDAWRCVIEIGDGPLRLAGP